MTVTALVAQRQVFTEPEKARGGFLEPLNTLRLDAAPFQTNALKALRLIRTETLDIAVEGVEAADDTALLLDLHLVARRFGLPVAPMHPDLILLGRLGRLTSFDAPTLRLFLRHADLPAAPYRALNIAEDRLADLNRSMAFTTAPLWQRLPASYPGTAAGPEERLHRLRHPPSEKAGAERAAVAAHLGVAPERLADIVEDQADMYLSMRYYADCNTGLTPVLDTVRRSLRRRCGDGERRSPGHRAAELLAGVQQRLGNHLLTFGSAVGGLWNATSPTEFARTRTIMETSHRIAGATLSAVAAKINWMYRRFPGWTAAAPTGTTDTSLLDLYRSFLDLERFSGHRTDPPSRAVWS